MEELTILKRTRKKKEIPLYSIIDNTPFQENRISTYKINEKGWKNGNFTEARFADSPIQICPHCTFIPISYLFYGMYEYFNITIGRFSSKSLDVNLELINKDTLLSGIVRSQLMNSREKFSPELSSRIFGCLNSWIKKTSPVGIDVGWDRDNLKYIDEVFPNFKLTRLTARTFNAFCGYFSLYLENQPLIQCVILPENYEYQKLHMLLYNSLDMSKVIFLIDKELDSPQFRNLQLRTLYRKKLLPIIEGFNSVICKVPAEIISEYCEIPRNIELSSNILERKKQISELVNKFKEEYYSEEEENLYSDLEDDDDDDIFDDDFDMDNEESYTTYEITSQMSSSESIQHFTVDVPL